jgi:hypothetical protein
MEAMVLTNPFLPSTHGRMLMFWNITPCFVWFPLHAFNSQLPQAKENGNKKKKKHWPLSQYSIVFIIKIF